MQRKLQKNVYTSIKTIKPSSPMTRRFFIYQQYLSSGAFLSGCSTRFFIYKNVGLNNPTEMRPIFFISNQTFICLSLFILSSIGGCVENNLAKDFLPTPNGDEINKCAVAVFVFCIPISSFLIFSSAFASPSG